jgi:hypothetical protein
LRAERFCGLVAIVVAPVDCEETILGESNLRACRQVLSPN